MAKVDLQFIENCYEIMCSGVSSEGQRVRAIWPDTKEPAHTLKKFGIVNRYNLQEEFPILSIRNINFRSAIDEILWIWQRKSNNIHDLHSHIWDSWADEQGSIGTAYGYQESQI